MAKLNLTDVSNVLTATNTINTNSAAIETAMENTLSRDGTTPNEMNSDLDMNNNRIYNLPEPADNNDPVRKIDVDNLIANIPSVFVPGDKATQVDAETGTDNFKWMTPLRTAQAIDAQLPLASQAEAEAGTDNTKYLSALRVKQAITANIPPVEVLSAARTIYVRKDGSDSNSGLVNNAGGAFLTIGKAVSYCQARDLNDNNITISINTGTYAEDVTVTGPNRGGGRIIFVAPAGTVTFDGPSEGIIVSDGAIVEVNGTNMVFSGGNFHLHATRFASIYARGFTLGACAEYQIYSTRFGYIEIDGGYSVSGGAKGMLQASHHGHIRLTASTVTLLANVTYTEYVNYSLASADITWTNGCSVNYNGFTATGTKVMVDGSIMQWGAGTIDFPLGSGTGIEANGGKFLTGNIEDVIIGNSTFGLSSASGATFVISGLNILPGEIELMANIDGTETVTRGWIGGSAQRSQSYCPGLGWFSSATTCMLAYVDSSNYTSFSLTARPKGGFTLTSTKTGAPTGTLQIMYKIRRGL